MEKTFGISLLAAAGLLASCARSEIEYDKGSTPLELRASTDNAVLDIRNPDARAIAFTWSSGSNRGTNAAIDYLLEIDRETSNFASPQRFELGRNIFTKEFSHSALNDLLIEKFSVGKGVAERMAARLTATVAGGKVEAQVSETVIFTVTTYEPVSSTLFMIGDATAAGWSLAAAPEMTPVAGLAGGFTWTGMMKAGEFKFLTSNSDFTPSYNLATGSADGSDMLYRTDYNGVEDTKFTIPDEGNYRVTANLITLRMTIARLPDKPAPRFNALLVEGELWDNPVPMRLDVDNSFLFRYGTIFERKGEGKFWFSAPTGETFRPATDDAPITTTAAAFRDGGNAWALTDSQSGKGYKITIDITAGAESMKMTLFEPYPELWMIGNATTAEWSFDNVVPLIVEGYNYSWEGPLKAGEMKITCDKQTDWNGVWIMPSVANQLPGPATTDANIIDKIGNPDVASVDRKWKIETPGRYRITGNQLTETITIEAVR